MPSTKMLDEFTIRDRQAQTLAADLRRKPDAAKEAALKKLVEESFDKRHAAQEAEAKALEERLRKTLDLLKKRQDNRSEIVARRIKQLRGERDDLEWETVPSRPVTGMPPAAYPSPSDYQLPRTDNPFGGPPSAAPLPGSSVPGPTRPASDPRPPLPGEGDMIPPVAPGIGAVMGGGLKAMSGTSRTVPPDPVTPADLSPTPKPAAANSTADVKTLEIELQLARVNLSEVEASYQRNKLSPTSVAVEEMDKTRFAVERAKLAVDLAARRLELARGSAKPPAESMPSTAPPKGNDRGS